MQHTAFFLLKHFSNMSVVLGTHRSKHGSYSERLVLVTGTRYSGCQDSIARTLIKNSECFDSTMTKEERKSHNKKLKTVGNSSNSSEAPTSSQESTPNILSLNDDVFQEIFSHCSFDEVSKMRSVCRRFNVVCQKTLNKGFLAVQRYHSQCVKDMQAKLPRRESERRVHPLARRFDMLTGIETRLSLLSMTYYKYTTLGVFCFIPGKVLDECYRVLREVLDHEIPPKSYELLQELRHISSTAMEHFEQHIVPTMKKNHSIMNAALHNNSPRFIHWDEDMRKNDLWFKEGKANYENKIENPGRVLEFS